MKDTLSGYSLRRLISIANLDVHCIARGIGNTLSPASYSAVQEEIIDQRGASRKSAAFKVTHLWEKKCAACPA